MKKIAVRSLKEVDLRRPFDETCLVNRLLFAKCSLMHGQRNLLRAIALL